MPVRAKRPCSKCGSLSCSCAPVNYDSSRSDDLIRKFEHSAQWKSTPKRFRASNPLCVSCKVSFTAVADHIIPARIYLAQLAASSDEDDKLRAYCDESNLQPLCKACHDSKKQRAEKRAS